MGLIESIRQKFSPDKSKKTKSSTPKTEHPTLELSLLCHGNWYVWASPRVGIPRPNLSNNTSPEIVKQAELAFKQECEDLCTNCPLAVVCWGLQLMASGQNAAANLGSVWNSMSTKDLLQALEYQKANCAPYIKK